MPRTPLVVGNWKMNLNHLEALNAVQKLAFALPKDYYERVDVGLTVPFTDLRSVQTLIEGDRLPITFGAQDVSRHEEGAHTGEIAASMLAKLNCTWVVVGHSERRRDHGEDDELVAAKARAALGAGLTPIVCVGEPAEVRDAGGHVDYVTEQLRGSLEGIDDTSRVVVAYEPVWAIGTGRAASGADAQEVAAAIREAAGELSGADAAEKLRILYGGSVKTDTVAGVVGQRDVDGALVGGASLDGQEFARLVAAAAS